jgi:hypothetical protein
MTVRIVTAEISEDLQRERLQREKEESIMPPKISDTDIPF